jgi:hypothetical protein
MYEEQAPYAYPAMDPCPFPEISRSPERWVHDAVFSCESEDATQFEWTGANVVRRLTLDAAGTYELTVSGGEGVLMVGCQTEVLEQRPPDFSNGDLRNEAELSQTACTASASTT